MEYEYSIKVKNIDEYLDYCKKNNYKKEKEIKQTRTVYKKTKHKIARITVEEAKTTTKVLDFKEDRYSKDALNIRKESKPLLIIDEKVAEEVLNFLGYKKKVTLVRNRIIFRRQAAPEDDQPQGRRRILQLRQPDRPCNHPRA